VIRVQGAQVSAEVYSSTMSEDIIFRLMCDVVRERRDSKVAGAKFAPVGIAFEAASDILPRLETIDGPAALDTVPDGTRPVEASVTTATLGPIRIKFNRTPPPETHPVAAVFAAETLGIPVELWSAPDRIRARTIATEALEILRAVCARGEVLYGHLALEATLPAPAGVMEDDWVSRDALFLSNTLVDVDSSFLNKIRHMYGKDVVEEWETGVFVCGWAPFSAAEFSVANPQLLHEEISRYLANRLRFLRQ